MDVDVDIAETRQWKLSILDKVFNNYLNHIHVSRNFAIADYVLLNLASFCVLRLTKKKECSTMSSKYFFNVLSKLLAVIHKKQKPMPWGTVVNVCKCYIWNVYINFVHINIVFFVVFFLQLFFKIENTSKIKIGT